MRQFANFVSVSRYRRTENIHGQKFFTIFVVHSQCKGSPKARGSRFKLIPNTTMTKLILRIQLTTFIQNNTKTRKYWLPHERIITYSWRSPSLGIAQYHNARPTTHMLTDL